LFGKFLNETGIAVTLTARENVAIFRKLIENQDLSK
jgi:hypothetical protein